MVVFLKNNLNKHMKKLTQLFALTLLLILVSCGQEEKTATNNSAINSYLDDLGPETLEREYKLFTFFPTASIFPFSPIIIPPISFKEL